MWNLVCKVTTEIHTSIIKSYKASIETRVDRTEQYFLITTWGIGHSRLEMQTFPEVCVLLYGPAFLRNEISWLLAYHAHFLSQLHRLLMLALLSDRFI